MDSDQIDGLIVTTWPERQIGGQQCGSGPMGIKIVHEPTGLTVMCDVERSQHLNRLIAMDMMIGGLTSPHLRWFKPQ